jgi:ribosomal protein S18 acetylase RimI-like enzyme
MYEDGHSVPEIRKASKADVRAIQDLHHALCRFEYDNGFDLDIDLQRSYSTEFADYLEGRIAEPTGAAFVVRLEDVVTGYLVGSMSEGTKGKRARLESMFVLPEHRRSGIGQRLVSEFLSWVQKVGGVAATVAVAPGNSAAVALYRKLGFRDQTLILEVRAVRTVGETRETPTSQST